MALATGMAFGAAALSGAALGSSCRVMPSSLSGGHGGPPGGPGPDGPTAPAPAKPSPTRLPVAGDAERGGACGEGFTVEEARAHADAAQARAMERSPREALAELQRGNMRFWTNSATRPECGVLGRRALATKQFPSVALLCCADSRVPPEIIFDQGLGDLFVVRVAGNALDTSTMASLQFAVKHLKVKAVVVLGHELCGAVKAAQLPEETLDGEPLQLAQALKSIKKGLDQGKLAQLRDARAVDREAVVTNVRRQVERLAAEDCLMQKVRSGELIVSGAFYELSSGLVDFFAEVSGA